MVSRRILGATFAAAALATAGRWLQLMMAGPLQTAAVVVVIASATGLVLLEGGQQPQDSALAGPLRPVELDGRIHDEWRDVFDVTGLPAGLVKNLKGGAEVVARSFVMDAAILDLSVLRADGLAPCGPLAGGADGSWARSLCPLRLTLYRGQRHARQLRGTACLPPRGAQGSRTFATFDPTARIVTITTTIGGREAPECQRTISLATLQDSSPGRLADSASSAP